MNARRPKNCGGRGSRCPKYRGSPPKIISCGAHGVSFFLDSPFNRTNIQLLRSWGEWWIVGYYKHSAPPELGRVVDCRVLQTFSCSGAGESGALSGTTNIQLLRSWGEWLIVGYYKHSAPL